MKAIIPTAGKGTRLYPHTHTKPKPMVRLAGRPILGHILSSFAETNVETVVLVVGGPMQSQIVEYAETTFGDRFEFEFVEQESAEGLGHSIYQAEEVTRGDDVIIALGDMLFQNGYRTFLQANRDSSTTQGTIGVKPVEEPQHYGIVELSDGRISRLVEKPPSDLAISGVYIIEDTPALFDALEYLVENDVRGAGDEYQLTDALNRMVEQDTELGTFEVDDWYDCGRSETLLQANQILLDDLDTDGIESLSDTVLIEPVDIGDDVTLESSVIGPHVSIDDGAEVKQSIVKDSIIGRESEISDINLRHSIIGDSTHVVGKPNTLDIGDNSSINL